MADTDCDDIRSDDGAELMRTPLPDEQSQQDSQDMIHLGLDIPAIHIGPTADNLAQSGVRPFQQNSAVIMRRTQRKTTDDRSRAEAAPGGTLTINPEFDNPVADRSKKRHGKTEVYVQVVFIKLGEIDTIKENFTADVFIQARWREPSLDGMHNAMNLNVSKMKWKEYWNPKLYIDNTVGDPKETIGHTVVYNMYSWEAFILERRRVKGAFLENLELFHFPFDTQDLTITILSELTDDEVSLQDDPTSLSTINVESFVDEQEWRLYNEVVTFTDVISKFYQGDTAENTMHPSISCRTHAARRAGFYIINVFVFMFFISSMTFATYAIEYRKPENRIQLNFLLLLCTITFKFAASNFLPRVSYLTTLDVYGLMTMFVLMTSLIWHASVPSVGNDWKEATARKCDMIVVIVFGLLFATAQISFALFIMIRAIRRRWFFEEKERIHKQMLNKEKKKSGDMESALQDVRRASAIAYRMSQAYDMAQLLPVDQRLAKH